MPDAMTAPAAIGHNSGIVPPPEMLAEETAALSARSTELLGAAERCHVQDDDTAGRAVTLAKMLKDHAKKIDTTRADRKAPYLEAGRVIDGHFKALVQPVEAAAQKVVAMVDAFRREQERRAEEERRRLAEEARRQEEEAERLRRAAAAAGDTEAEIAAEHAANQAAALHQRAAAVEKPVVQSDYGAKAVGRTVKTASVTDPKAFVAYLLRADKARLVEALTEIAQRLVRAGVAEIPGVEITTTTTTTIR